jgi:hypothetical protein
MRGSALAALFLILIGLLHMLPIIATAHPGNTDSSGCHTCRTNCPDWGYDYGEYHCHGGGGSSGGGAASYPSYTPAPYTPSVTPSSIVLHDASTAFVTGEPPGFRVHAASIHPIASAWVNYQIEFPNGQVVRFDEVRMSDDGKHEDEFVFAHDASSPLPDGPLQVVYDFVVYDSQAVDKNLGPITVDVLDNDSPAFVHEPIEEFSSPPMETTPSLGVATASAAIATVVLSVAQSKRR